MTESTRLLLKNLLFTFVVPGTVGVYLPNAIVTEYAAPGSGRWIVGLALLALGGAIYAWCVWDFARVGRGTPAPIDAPRVLVERGLYQWVRNPMYVGVLAVVLGQAVLYASGRLAAYALAVGSLFHLFIVLYEEPKLKELFGPGYEDYCRRVGRWWPRGKAASTAQP
ncbi:MAG: methyltransferase family protein [Myxococcota bacterium]